MQSYNYIYIVVGSSKTHCYSHGSIINVQAAVQKVVGVNAHDPTKLVKSLKWAKKKVRAFRVEERREVGNYSNYYT